MNAEASAGPQRRCDVIVVDNGTNHVLFGEIARQLQTAHGLRVVYLTLIPARVAYFESRGIEARLLRVSGRSDSDVASGAAVIQDVERRFAGYRLGASIRSDRVLRWYPVRAAERVVASAALGFQDLLRQLQPRLILGEVSWAIEHLFFFMSEGLGIPYRHLLNLPGRKLLVAAFDATHTAAGTGRIGERVPASTDSTDKSYAELCGAVRAYRPSLRYFLGNFRMVYSRNDYRQALFYRLRRLLLPIYRWAQRLFEAMHAMPPPEARDHVLLVLHVQPESTPDYVAPFYADQVRLAEGIVSGLGRGQYLYVKDHPNVLSVRNLWKWRRLLRGGRVRLLHREIAGVTLLSKFQTVVSIAGTALLECARHGIPAISVSDVFFNELPNVLDGRRYSTFAEALAAAAALTPKLLSDDDMQAFLSKFGMPGFVHDARVAPDVLDRRNIERLGRLVQVLLVQGPLVASPSGR